eukprot:542875-Rhodomonas_salina.3
MKKTKAPQMTSQAMSMSLVSYHVSAEHRTVGADRLADLELAATVSWQQFNVGSVTSGNRTANAMAGPAQHQLLSLYLSLTSYTRTSPQSARYTFTSLIVMFQASNHSSLFLARAVAI